MKEQDGFHKPENTLGNEDMVNDPLSLRRFDLLGARITTEGEIGEDQRAQGGRQGLLDLTEDNLHESDLLGESLDDGNSKTPLNNDHHFWALDSSAPPSYGSAGKTNDDKESMWSYIGKSVSTESCKSYFDVTTDDVAHRLQSVFMPWNSSFFDVVNEKPDLYGPFWISMTLVLIISVMYNFTSWNNSFLKIYWSNDFGILSTSALFVFGSLICMPLVAISCFRLAGMAINDISFADLVCIYGYSIATFSFACVCSAFNSGTLTWFSVLVSLSVSVYFIFHNLWRRLGSSNVAGYIPPSAVDSESNPGQSSTFQVPASPRMDKITFTLLIGLVGLHVVFAIILRLAFL